MAFYTSAGTVIYISAELPATYDEAGFTAVAGREKIGEVTSISERGDAYNLVNHQPLETRRTKVVKGSTQVKEITAGLAIDREDAGQVLAQEFNSGDKVDNPCTIAIVTSDGWTEYFTTLISGFTTSNDGVDSIISGSMTMASGEDSIFVAPAP